MSVPGLSHRRAIIVGAGQAGLAVAARLRSAGLSPNRDFAVIDANPHGNRAWSSRWHSMELLSDARYSAVADLAHPGAPTRRLHPPDMEKYLAGVEAFLGVATMWGIRVTGIEHRSRTSTLVLSTTDGPVQTRNVICATGAAHRPRRPGWAAGVSVPGMNIHSADYRTPAQIPTGDVLIIGGGHSGIEIARELAGTHAVALSLGSHRPLSRERLAPRPGSQGPWRCPGADREILEKELRDRGVAILPKATNAVGGAIVLEGGIRATPHSVIFATGYVPGDGWLPDAAKHASLRERRRARTPIPGLFVAGIPSYTRPGADTLLGVQRDAARIARHIINRP